MAVTGNLDAMRDFGGRPQSIMDVEVPTPPLLGDGLLSTGLGDAHDSVAQAAGDFARSRDSEAKAAGDGLRQVAGQLTDFDGQNATAIRRI